MKNQLTHQYTNNIHNKKIIIIGPHPPPLGGVAIHIKRVRAKLIQQKNDMKIFDTATQYKTKLHSFFNLIKTILLTRPDIIYFHEPTESLQKLASVVLLKQIFRFKLIVVDHDCRLLYKFSKNKRKLFRTLMQKVNLAIVMGNTTEQCYIDNKIERATRSESPFLPPDLSEEQTLLKNYPTSIHEFLRSHSPIISANAFAPILIGGKDLYGFDTSISLMQKLKTKYPNIGLIFGICKNETPEQKQYFAKIQKLVQKLNLTKNILLLFSKGEFWPIIKSSDVFIRPTLSDSFGISVQEAIFFDVPAFATRVCERPEGTILFETQAFVPIRLRDTVASLRSRRRQ